MRRFLFGFILCLALSSCCDRAAGNELRALMGSEIRYPQELLAVHDTVRYPVAGFAPSVKLLLYYHRDECSHCRLAHLTDYRKFFGIAGRSLSQFRILPIFAPEAAWIFAFRYGLFHDPPGACRGIACRFIGLLKEILIFVNGTPAGRQPEGLPAGDHAGLAVGQSRSADGY